MLDKKIEELGDYFISLEKFNGNYIGIKVKLPENWVIFEKVKDEKKENDYSIVPVKKQEDGGRITFVGDPNSKASDVIDFIKKIIKSNSENEEKKSLFNKKVKELGSIFDNNELSYLKNLIFDFQPKNNAKVTAEVITFGQSNDEAEISSALLVPKLKGVGIKAGAKKK
jgi:hypothetical protein